MNYSGYASLHARHIPEKVCLIERTPAIGERRSFTWKEFNDGINRTANYLSKELGVKHGDFVMHLQNNSLEWVLTYYAIIRLGAVVVPLNFRQAERQVAYLHRSGGWRVAIPAALDHQAGGQCLRHGGLRHWTEKPKGRANSPRARRGVS